MSLQCIKTGCIAYLDPYGEVVRGDLFQFIDSPAVIMRICARDIGGSFAHAFITHVEHWWDEHATDLHATGMPRNSTLVGTMSRFNYDGL